MKIIGIIAVLVSNMLFAYACFGAEPITTDQTARIEEAVKYKLKDSGSAQFRNVRMTGSIMFCGEVNAKNSYGGYVGYRTFFGILAPDEVDVTLGDSDFAEEMNQKMCAGK